MSGIQFTFLISVLLYLTASPLPAQNITVINERDLSFGTVFSGTQQNLIVNLDDPNSAFFQVTGPQGANVYISFILPANLVNTAGSGTIPLLFNETSAGWNWNVNQTPPGDRIFDPEIGADARLHPGGGQQGGRMYVWLGSIITVDAQQPGGAYSGTATMIVERTDI